MKKRNWLKSVERDFKSKRYRKLFREFRRTSDYATMCQEIESYLVTEPDWGKPVVVQSVPDEKKIVLGKRFQTWWRFGGGREYADARYSFSVYDWKFMTRTEAELKAMALDDHVESRMKTVRLIAERVMNERLSDQIDHEYNEAVQSGAVSLEYKPFEVLDSPFADMFRSRSIGKHDDGSVESASESVGNSSMRQEWYRDGTPRLSLIEDAVTKTIEKKLWYENGNRQCLIHYADGQLHGVLCRWSEDGRLIYAAHYEHGEESGLLSSEEVATLPEFAEVLSRPSEEEQSGVSIGIYLGEGEEKDDPNNRLESVCSESTENLQKGDGADR